MAGEHPGANRTPEFQRPSGGSATTPPSTHPASPSRTLARAAELHGPGLFNPAPVTLRIVPVPPTPDGRDGLRLRRTDHPGQPEIPALASRVLVRPRRTVLAPDAAHIAEGLPIETVEHLLSAAVGLGVTAAVLEVGGSEVPMMDGSALAFAQAIRAAGVRPATLAGGPGPVVLRSSVRLTDGQTAALRSADGGGPVGEIVAEPWDRPELVLTYNLDYGPGSPIPPQSFTWVHRWHDPDAESYIREVAPARTFATEQEADAFRAAGHFAHVAPGTVLVLGQGGPRGTTLRFENEPARHKVLDMLGDLALAGRPIYAKVTASRTGHALNQRLAGALAALT